MKKVALVGAGIMGGGIAANFLKSGYPVIVWNRTTSHVQALVNQGAILAATPREAAEQADIVFEVTADDASSRAAWSDGETGILAGATANKVLITCATLSADWVSELAKVCGERGLTFFDMPMTGGRVAAESGSLTLLVGGDEAKLNQLKPELEPISSKIFYFGPVTSGMKYKLILNSLQGAHIVAYGEALALAKKAGLDLELVGSALVYRPGGEVTNVSRGSYHNQPNPITFSVDWITKDLVYARRMAGNLELPILDDVLAEYKRVQQGGHGSDDWTVVNESK